MAKWAIAYGCHPGGKPWTPKRERDLRQRVDGEVRFDAKLLEHLQDDGLIHYVVLRHQNL